MYDAPAPYDAPVPQPDLSGPASRRRAATWDGDLPRITTWATTTTTASPRSPPVAADSPEHAVMTPAASTAPPATMPWRGGHQAGFGSSHTADLSTRANRPVSAKRHAAGGQMSGGGPASNIAR
jgi:hypothetical protein